MLWIESKYAKLLGPRLPLFKHLRGDIYNFRCPICGDSDKSKTKTRGYFYSFKNHMNFRCHNCGESSSFYNFLKDFDGGLFQDMKMELFRERKQNKRTVTQPEKLTFKQSRKKPIIIKHELYGFDSVADLPVDHAAVVYVKNRMIPKHRWPGIFYCDQISQLANKLSGYEKTKFDAYSRILLPFINEDGLLTHIQARAIDRGVPKSKRYITLELKDEPKVYGMDSINREQDIFIVEGPLDSMFIPNCVAMGGADIPVNLFDPSKTIFIFDNEPRNEQMLKRMQKVAELGFGLVVWDKKIVEKDINDMVLSGIKPRELIQYIKKHTFRSLRAKLQIANFRGRR